MALGHKVTFLHGTASCCINPSEAISGIPDTAVLHRSMDLEWVSSDLFLSVSLRERDRMIHKFLWAYGGKYHSDDHQRNKIYGERPSFLIG